MILRIIIIVFGLAVMAGVIVNIAIPPGSHPWPKHDEAQSQIEMLQNYANGSKEPFVTKPSMDNESFVATAKRTGAYWISSQMFKYNVKGELLDPWGMPYIITSNSGQITVTSPGLNKYKKLSSFQQWLINE